MYESEIRKLEALYKQYKKKRLKRYFFAFFAVALFVLGAMMIYLFIDKDKKRVVPNHVEAVSSNEETGKKLKNVLPKQKSYSTKIKIDTYKNECISAPPIKVLASKQPKGAALPKENIVSPHLPVEPVKEIPVLDEVEMPIEQKAKPKINFQITQMPQKTEEIQKSKIEIKTRKGKQAYKEVIDRFKRYKDPHDALFLAQVYFKKKEFEKAEYWAYQVLAIKPQDDEALAIFVRSKLKQGRINEALKTLQKFIDMHGSKKAQEILQKLKR